MAATTDERFETATTGYEEVWTPVTTGGSTLAPATPVANTPAIWDKQACLYNVVAATTCYLARTLTAAPITFTCWEGDLVSEAISDGGFVYTALAVNGAQILWYSLYQQIAGQVYHSVVVRTDGTNDVVVSQVPMSTGLPFRTEVKWDSTADSYQVWHNGISQASGALTGAAATTQFLTLAMGNWTAVGTSAAVYALDVIRTDNAARPIDGVGGGAYQQQYYLTQIAE